MKYLVYALITLSVIFLYVLFNEFAVGLLRPRGEILRKWYLGEKEVTFPFREKVSEKVERVFKTFVFSDEEKTRFLVVQSPFVHGLEVKINGEVVLRRGMEKPMNMWTTALLAPLDLKKGKNVIELKISALYDYTIPPPFIVEKPSLIVPRMMFLVGLPIFSAGVLAAIGLILIFMSLKLAIPYRNVYGIFGTAFVMRSVWLSNFIPLMMPPAAFLVWKKSIFALTHWIRGFYNLGVEMRAGRRYTSKYVFAVLIFYTVFAFTVKDISTARRMGYYLSYFVLGVMIYDLILIAMKKDPWLFSAFLTSVLNTAGFIFIRLMPYHPSFTFVESIYFSVVFSIILLREFEDMKEKLEKESVRSMIDPLTQVHNRRVLGTIDFTSNDSILFLDLNDFKLINDNFGHEFGDEVLKDFAKVLKNSVRSNDVVVRYGGDEFVVVLKGCDMKEAEEIARRISEEFEKIRGVKVAFGVCGGIGNLKEAIKIADERMYEMKRRLK